MTKGSLRGCYRSLLHFSFLSIFLFALAFGQENTGRILGTVTDDTGAVVPDAKIVATSPSSPKGLETMSDANGNYTLFNVPLGVYTINVSKAGFATVRQQNVNVTLGAQLNYNPKLSIGQVTQVVEVTDSVVSLDTTSSRVSTNIASSQFDNLAKGRNFNSILALAPGVRSEPKNGSAGVGGIQVDGASGAENAFLVDGVDTSDVRRGSLRVQFALPFEMIQEVQVKSGGFEAEYGGATGGVVNVATKGGSNEFHGEGWFQFTNDATNAGDRGFYQRSPLNANLADFYRPKEDNYHIYYPGFRIGGPIIKNQIFFSGTYSPELEHTTRTIDFTQSPNNAALGTKTYEQDIKRHYGLGRVDYQPVQKVQITSSYFWSPLKQIGILPNRDARVAPPTNDLSIQGGFAPAQTYSAGVTYTATPKLIITGRYGYRYLNDKPTGSYGISGAPFITYQTSALGVAGVPSDLQKGSGYSNVSSTLKTLFDITTRHNVYLDATYVAGKHTIKGGYYLARLANRVQTDYSNGRFQIYWGDKYSRGSVTNQAGQYGYYLWQDGVTNRGAVTSRNQGLYIQDGWRVSSRLSLNFGVRFENEFLPPYKAEVNGVKVANPVSFDWGSKIAPRVGAAWDVKGDGRYKLSGSYGIFYDVLKYELARGSFGSDWWFTSAYKLDNPNVLNLSITNPGALGTLIQKYDNRTLPINAQGQIEGVDPGMKPYKSQEFTVNFEHSFATRLVGGVRYTHKDLLRAIEDIGVLDAEDSEQYVTGNPGFGQTRDPKSVYGGKTPNGNWLVPEAIRNYNAVEFRLQGQMNNFGFIGSYTWSRLYGNYSGAANSDESGRQDPGVSRAFDLPYYYFDSTGSQQTTTGPLGTDRPNTFKFYGNYDLKWKAGRTNFGLNQVAFSGTPDSTTVIYLSAPTFPNGRGDMGRTPFYTQTDLLFTHTFSFTERLKAKFEANILNLFNQATVISRVTQLNRSSAISAAVLPPDALGKGLFNESFFKGYTLSKYVNASAPASGVAGVAVPYNAIYKLPGGSYVNGSTNLGTGASSASAVLTPNFGAYQDFRVIRLGFRFIF